MKILILANNCSGLWGFRRDLIVVLSKVAEVVASIPRGDHWDEFKSIGCRLIETPIDRRGIDPRKDMKLYKAYCRLIENEKPDLIITYTIKPNIYGGYAARKHGIPYAVNITGLGTAFQKKGMLRRLVTVMYRTGLKKAKVVFFENEENRRVFVDNHIVRESQTRLLMGAGVNTERFPYTDYPADGGIIRFLYIGRVMKEKGVDELFTAMERLHAEGAPCELHVLGGYEEDYESRISVCEAAGWLHYHGYQTDVRPFIADCHCSVLPSYHEGMSNVNLECASMGRPLITSRIHGCMEAVEEGKSGLLCERQNADSLYEAMKTFISLPHEQKAAMGLAGRKHMEEVFEKSKVVEATVKGLGL